jgi:hypothetical protein
MVELFSNLTRSGSVWALKWCKNYINNLIKTQPLKIVYSLCRHFVKGVGLKCSGHDDQHSRQAAVSVLPLKEVVRFKLILGKYDKRQVVYTHNLKACEGG